MNKTTNTNKGITLIALIITVIVLLILAGTAVTIAINGGDIFGRATEAKEGWNTKVAEEETTLNENIALLDMLTNTTSQTPGLVPEETISKETTGEGFVGCYADVDGDGDIDGIIYVDLLVGKPVSPWETENYAENGVYDLPTDVTASNVKDYVQSESTTTDERFDNTARYVISPASSTTGTKDRFYVMGLNDITDGTNDTLYWYYYAYDSVNEVGKMTDYETYTLGDFGKGRENTTKMLTKWDAEGYGEQNDRDLWKWINVKTGEANEGWFVPSRGEWAAFGNEFNITGSNYSSFGMSMWYWSSSQGSDYSAYFANTREHCIDTWGNVYSSNAVRLSTTF